MNILIMRWIMLLPFSVKLQSKYQYWWLCCLTRHECQLVYPKFKKYTGSTPMQFIVGIRINNAQMLLETTTYSINEISKIVGYDNSFISAGFFTNWKDIRQENTESWETNSEIHKEDTTELSKQWFVVSSSHFCYSYFTNSAVFISTLSGSTASI